MVRLLSLFVFLITIHAKAAVVPSGVPQIGVGFMATNQTASSFAAQSIISDANISSAISGFGAGYFELATANQPTFTAGNVAAWYRNGVQYVVTTGKTAVCIGIRIQGQVAATAQLVTAVSTFSHNTAPGSMPGSTTYQGGADGRMIYYLPGTNNALSEQLFYIFTTGQYPGLQITPGSGTGGVSARMTCKEI